MAVAPRLNPNRDTDKVAVVEIVLDYLEDIGTGQTSTFATNSVETLWASLTYSIASTTRIRVLDVRDVMGTTTWSTTTGAAPNTAQLDIHVTSTGGNPVTTSPAVLAKIVLFLEGSANETTSLTMKTLDVDLTGISGMASQKSEAANTYQRGDALQDGTTNIVDALAVLQCHFNQTPVGTTPGTECHPINGGTAVNDGSGPLVNIVDALALQKHFNILDIFFK